MKQRTGNIANTWQVFWRRQRIRNTDWLASSAEKFAKKEFIQVGE